MIIIKTQSGSITPVESPYIVARYKEEIVIDEIGLNEIYHECIATYDTEERAKEVMNMIDNHIRENYLFKAICNISNTHYPDVTFTDLYDTMEEHKTNAIFTMPE